VRIRRSEYRDANQDCGRLADIVQSALRRRERYIRADEERVALEKRILFLKKKAIDAQKELGKVCTSIIQTQSNLQPEIPMREAVRILTRELEHGLFDQPMGTLSAAVKLINDLMAREPDMAEACHALPANPSIAEAIRQKLMEAQDNANAKWEAELKGKRSQESADPNAACSTDIPQRRSPPQATGTDMAAVGQIEPILIEDGAPPPLPPIPAALPVLEPLPHFQQSQRRRSHSA
jgi:hypothetical protein